MTCAGYGCPNPIDLHATFCSTCAHAIADGLATIPPNPEAFHECPTCGYQRYGEAACHD